MQAAAVSVLRNTSLNKAGQKSHDSVYYSYYQSGCLQIDFCVPNRSRYAAVKSEFIIYLTITTTLVVVKPIASL